MAAGRAAGMKTIGALWGQSDPGELERSGADVLAARPIDLLALVRGAAL
jgi:phosphoglycolate phosphatase-like HAD superfamily hydrolase